MSQVIHNCGLFVARDGSNFAVGSRLVAIGKFFREHPDGEVPTGFWTKPYWDRVHFRRWSLACLQDKINAHDPLCPKGRHAADDAQLEPCKLRTAAHHRIVVDWLPPALLIGRRVHAAFSKRLREHHAV